MRDVELLVSYQLRAVRIGVRTTLIVIAYALIYPYLPGSNAVRWWEYYLVLAAATVGVVGVSRLPWPLLFRTTVWRVPLGEAALYAWSVADILLISAEIALSGGQHSEFVYLYALTTLFFAAVYPLRGQRWLLAFTASSYLLTVLALDRPLNPAATFFRICSFAAVALVTSFLSRELIDQMREHERARTESERRAHLLAVVAEVSKALDTHDVAAQWGAARAALDRFGFAWTALRSPRKVGVDGATGAIEARLVPAHTLRERGYPVPSDIATCVIQPVAHDGKLVAEIVVGGERASEFSSAEREALTLLASRFGSALQATEYNERIVRGARRFTSLVQQSSDLIVVLSDDWIISYASDAVARMVGVRGDELIGFDARTLVHEEGRRAFSMALKNTSDDPRSLPRIEARIRSVDGGWRQVEFVLTNLLSDESVHGILLNGRDVTERRELENRLRHSAENDSLTGLPNRQLFAEHVKDTLRDPLSMPVVLFVDLDEFKAVNDRLGHLQADQLIVEIAHRIRALLPEHDVVARFGGDEFAVCLTNEDRIEAVERIAARILAAVREPVEIAGVSVTTTASIGIALRLRTSLASEELMQMADFAMYEAKRLGRDRFALFDDHAHALVADRWELEAELRKAPGRDELELLYQPTVALRSQQTVGFEALLRWHHPARGLISPSTFIPIAESSDLILELGEWVLRTGISQLAEWRRTVPHSDGVELAINVSMRQLMVPAFPEAVAELLRQQQVPGENLTLEVTETALAANISDVAITLGKLRELGIRIAIDDFGMGYSSLGYLRDLPVDVLKIDRSFVNSMSTSREGTPVISAVLRLAEELGLTTIAEGIETDQQYLALSQLGCPYGQGFLFGVPEAASVVVAKHLVAASGRRLDSTQLAS